jgi:hypothetical protein
MERHNTSFLKLPTEIRLRIYDYILVGRSDRAKNLSPVKWSKKKIIFYDAEDPKKRPMYPAILRSCKKIHSEASPILYSKNTFYVDNPKIMIAFLHQIGSLNSVWLRIIDIWVTWGHPSPWIELLDMLSKRATGLRNIMITWGGSWRSAPKPICGLGCNLEFVHALARIRGLETLELSGFYAKPWPAFLEERMNVRVIAKPGNYFDIGKYPRDEGSEDEKVAREYNEKELQLFRDYQQGTEYLIP